MLDKETPITDTRSSENKTTLNPPAELPEPPSNLAPSTPTSPVNQSAADASPANPSSELDPFLDLSDFLSETETDLPKPDDVPDVITIASSNLGPPGAMKSPASSEKNATLWKRTTAGISADAVQGAGPGGFIPDDINRSSIDKSSEDQGVDNPTPNSVPPAANRGGGARGGRGRGGAVAPAGRGGPAHRARVMGGAGA